MNKEELQQRNRLGMFSRKKNYSIASMALTRIARLPWMIRTRFFSPYKILPIAQENKYLGIFSYFIMEMYVVCIH